MNENPKILKAIIKAIKKGKGKVKEIKPKKIHNII